MRKMKIYECVCLNSQQNEKKKQEMKGGRTGGRMDEPRPSD
jgi:hypothetical protein